MSKIFVEIDYITMAQWIKYGRYANKPKNEKVDEAFKKIMKTLDDAFDKVRNGGNNGEDH